MRVSKDGGRNYRQRDERDLSPAVPAQPAAVLIYNARGCARTVCFDLDASRGDVEADYATLTRMLDESGGGWISDHSPNGGRHVYLPLQQPAALHEVREVLAVLTTRLPTIDPQPMLNIASGCIRPPGARHRTGGHQRLDQPVDVARAVLEARGGDAAWEALRRLSPPKARTATAHTDAGGVSAEPLPSRFRHDSPTGPYLDIVMKGEWDSSRYPTPSEARQAAIWSCVATGMRLPDVAARVEDGTWPGLASLYARYSDRHRRSALVRDWKAAIALERRLRGARVESVHERTTSQPQTQRGGPKGRTGRSQAGARVGRDVSGAVREWLVAVDLLTRGNRVFGIGEKAVLYALGQAAMLTGQIEVEFGNRSLAVATGMDQASVGRVLASLNAAPADRRLIEKVRDADGPLAHRYRLVIPDLLGASCAAKPWRRGKVHGVRPVFRRLGLVAAFVYGALERSQEPLAAVDVAEDAGIGTAAAYDALATLAAFGLAAKSGSRWVVGGASPARLAERFGVEEEVAAQVRKYRLERIAWWRRLGLWQRVLMATGEIGPYDGDGMTEGEDPPPPPWPRAAASKTIPTPPVDWLDPAEQRRRRQRDDDAVALLESLLGAAVLEQIPHDFTVLATS